jgi:hypothetical protein
LYFLFVILRISKLLGNYDIQGTSPPETPPRKYLLEKRYLVLPTRYSREILLLNNP